jgi:hypothetical protein
LLAAEVLVGVCYALVGIAALAFFEHDARVRATLELV